MPERFPATFRLALCVACLVCRGAAGAVDTNLSPLLRLNEKLMQSARLGHPEAQFRVGVRYYFGMGRETNYTEALAWFRKGADGGSMRAQYRLGYMLYRGEGTETNLIEAYRWLTAAAAQGDTGAMHVALRFESEVRQLLGEKRMRAEQERLRKEAEVGWKQSSMQAVAEATNGLDLSAWTLDGTQAMDRAEEDASASTMDRIRNSVAPWLSRFNPVVAAGIALPVLILTFGYRKFARRGP